MKKFFIVLMCMMTLIFNTFAQDLELKMVKVPGANFEMLETEVTVALYEAIMGERPILTVRFVDVQTKEETVQKDNVQDGIELFEYPVIAVSAYDAIYFCNKLSEKQGLDPVYSVNGKTDVNSWDYIPHDGRAIKNKINTDITKNGYRLPTFDEWIYAAKGGESYLYPGSDDLNEVAWHKENSFLTYHPVAGKKPNAYGLYDIVGNVYEWCQEGPSSAGTSVGKSIGKATGKAALNFLSKALGGSVSAASDGVDIGKPLGGSYKTASEYCNTENQMWQACSMPSTEIGFRIVRTVY